MCALPASWGVSIYSKNSRTSKNILCSKVRLHPHWKKQYSLEIISLPCSCPVLAHLNTFGRVRPVDGRLRYVVFTPLSLLQHLQDPLTISSIGEIRHM